MQTARSSQPITGSQRCHPTCLKAAKELGGHRHSQDLSGDIPGGSTLLKRWDGTGNRQQPARAGRSRAPLPRRGTTPLNPTPFFFTIRPYRNTFFLRFFFLLHPQQPRRAPGEPPPFAPPAPPRPRPLPPEPTQPPHTARPAGIASRRPSPAPRHRPRREFPRPPRERRAGRPCPALGFGSARGEEVILCFSCRVFYFSAREAEVRV